MNSRHYKYAPPVFFPARSDRGTPWVFTENVATSKYLALDVEKDSGAGKGFLYCYTTLNPGKGQLEVPVPNFRDRPVRIRVDGHFVEMTSPKYGNWPSHFFERDEYIYFLFGIALS